MIRTHIRLDAKDYDLVKHEAKALGISVAEFVRRAIRHGLPSRSEAPWMRYAGFVESGNSRSSQTVDEVVYGGSRSRAVWRGASIGNRLREAKL